MEENLSTTNESEGTEEVNSTQEKTYTESEFISEVDRRVTQALKKQEAKNAEKVKEAQRLASMNEQQKYEYELNQREAAIAEKEKALTLAENKNTVAQILSEKGLSLSLVDFCVDVDADAMSNKISVLEKAFKASVKAEVEKRLGSSTPKKNLPIDTTITKEQFKKIKDPAVLLDIKNNQPELWEQLTK